MLRLTFVVIVFAIGVVAALVFYVWYALFRPQEWVWTDIDAYRLSTILGALLVIPCLMTGVWPVIGHPIAIGAVSFLATCLISQHGALNPEVGWYWIEFMAKLILISLIAVRLTSTPQRLVTLVAAIVASFGFHSAEAGLGSLLGGGLRFFTGTGGAFVDSNAYAVGCVMIVPLLIAVSHIASARWVRWLAAIGVPLTIVTIVSTYSRGGLLALIAALLTLALLSRYRWRIVAAAIVVVPVLLLFVRLPTGYTERMSTIQTYEEVGDDSALGRLHFWRVALHMAADRPLGVGLWNFESTYDQYDSSGGEYGTHRAVHNSHLQVLTETGWLGALCWAALFVTAFSLAIRARHRAALMDPDHARLTIAMANGLIASMAGFLVGGTVVSMAYNDLTWLTFALVASLDRLSCEFVAQQEPARTEAEFASPFDPVASDATVG